MRIVLAITFFFALSCSHSEKRNLSSEYPPFNDKTLEVLYKGTSSEQKATLQKLIDTRLEPMVRRATQEKDFKFIDVDKTVDAIYIFDAVKKKAGVLINSEVFLQSKQVWCEANFYIYDPAPAGPIECQWSLMCPNRLFKQYRERKNCPEISATE